MDAGGRPYRHRRPPRRVADHGPGAAVDRPGTGSDCPSPWACPSSAGNRGHHRQRDPRGRLPNRSAVHGATSTGPASPRWPPRGRPGRRGGRRRGPRCGPAGARPGLQSCRSAPPPPTPSSTGSLPAPPHHPVAAPFLWAPGASGYTGPLQLQEVTSFVRSWPSSPPAPSSSDSGAATGGKSLVGVVRGVGPRGRLPRAQTPLRPSCSSCSLWSGGAAAQSKSAWSTSPGGPVRLVGAPAPGGRGARRQQSVWAALVSSRVGSRPEIGADRQCAPPRDHRVVPLPVIDGPLLDRCSRPIPDRAGRRWQDAGLVTVGARIAVGATWLVLTERRFSRTRLRQLHPGAGGRPVLFNGFYHRRSPSRRPAGSPGLR